MTTTHGLSVGSKASLTKTITQQDINDFARISGDTQPLHLDPSYGPKTRFKRTVAHGTISIGLVSGVLGTKLVGPNTTVVFLGINCRFTKPVFPGDTVTATCEVTAIRPDRPIVTLKSECVNQNKEQVLTGEVTVLLDPFPLA
jgi:acyl dehydratase